MSKVLQPTCLVLVGLASILIYLIMQSAMAEPTAASYPESLDKIRDFHNQFTNPSHTSVDQERSKLLDMVDTSRLVQEKLFMKGPSQSLNGLISVNGMKHRSASYDGLLESTNCKMNSMNISVTGITVIAINMAQGGSAVATSDIILRPVQSLGVASPVNPEVDEKLK